MHGRHIAPKTRAVLAGSERQTQSLARCFSTRGTVETGPLPAEREQMVDVPRNIPKDRVSRQPALELPETDVTSVSAGLSLQCRDGRWETSVVPVTEVAFSSSVHQRMSTWNRRRMEKGKPEKRSGKELKEEEARIRASKQRMDTEEKGKQLKLQETSAALEKLEHNWKRKLAGAKA